MPTYLEAPSESAQHLPLFPDDSITSALLSDAPVTIVERNSRRERLISSIRHCLLVQDYRML